MMILDHLHVTAVSVNMAFSFSYTKNIFFKEVYQVCCWFYFYRRENLLSCLPANTRCDQVYASINARETSVLSRSSCWSLHCWSNLCKSLMVSVKAVSKLGCSELFLGERGIKVLLTVDIITTCCWNNKCCQSKSTYLFWRPPTAFEV